VETMRTHKMKPVPEISDDINIQCIGREIKSSIQGDSATLWIVVYAVITWPVFLCSANLVCCPLYATSILGLRTSQEVILAADSLRGVNVHGQQIATQTVCKIYQSPQGF